MQVKSKSKFCGKALSCITAAAVAVCGFAGINAFASGNMIYSDASKVIAGEEAKIPISISGNTGIAGFGLYITYDPAVITPVDTDDSQGLIAGKSEDTIGGTLKNLPENTVKVMYAAAENLTEDGLLFDFICTVDPDEVGTTTLKLSYVPNDTINEDIEEIALTCQDITLDIVNEAYDAMPTVRLSSGNAAAGEQVTVSGMLSNAGTLDSAEFSVSYDEENFDFVSAETAEGTELVSSNAENGVCTFELSGISETTGDEPLFKLYFDSSATANSGSYAFEAEAQNVIGAESIHIIGSETIITPSETSDAAIVFSDKELSADYGEELTVHVYISNNKGLCGYKLLFDYDSTLIITLQLPTKKAILFRPRMTLRVQLAYLMHLQQQEHTLYTFLL